MNSLTPKDASLIELNKIIQYEQITTLYQPIVCLQTANILGYEALSRGPKNSILEFPNKLFTAAKHYNRMWDIEFLCRKKAIEGTALLPSNQYLFLNVDPNIFNDHYFQKGLTKELLTDSSLSLHRIIFEITESSAIHDYNNFQNTLQNYVEQGYKIAIDDTGSGYSGLKLLTDVRPHFVKLDMELIRNIDQDGFKQTLLACFVKLARVTNMKIIAEGIESEAELKMLIELGVNYGQGYYLGQPQPYFQQIVPAVQLLITSEAKLNINYFTLHNTNFIGELAQIESTFSPNTKCDEIRNYLNVPEHSSAIIVKENRPIGLIMKNEIDSALSSSQYGYSVYLKRPISLIMNKSPLIYDYSTPIFEIVKTAMSRPYKNLYDSIIVTRNGLYFGTVSIKELIDFSTTLKCNYARELNPLTGLPGNLLIHQIMKDFIYEQKQCYIFYIDIDNFKIYNDNYGFEKGDSILHYTAKLIMNCANSILPEDAFIGHIGGDDFICVTQIDEQTCVRFSQAIISAFDKEIQHFFSDEDLQNGYISHTNRQGTLESHPLTSISVAAISANLADYQHYEEITKIIAITKKKAKQILKSCYIIEHLSES